MFLFVALAHAEIVDAVLHVVGTRIVTRSDLVFEADFDPHDHSPIAALEDPAYPLETRLVDYAILRELAGDIETYKPSAEDVNARWEHFRNGWPRPEEHTAFLVRWGLDDDALKGFLFSRLTVERFVARNVLQRTAETLDMLSFATYTSWITPLRARADVRTPR